MHTSSMLRMKWFADNYASKIAKGTVKVLDVGSCSVNGSYREIFADKKYEYDGLDMHQGPNVDIVLDNPYDWSKIESDTYDIIISGQAFEHIEFFWLTIAEIARVLKKNGLVCVIAPQGIGEHRYPVDCYRFFSDGMIALARYVGLEPIHAHTNSAPDSGCHAWFSVARAESMLIAKKNYYGLPRFIDPKTYVCVPVNQEILRTGLVPFKAWLPYYYIKRALRRILHGK